MLTHVGSSSSFILSQTANKTPTHISKGKNNPEHKKNITWRSWFLIFLFLYFRFFLFSIFRGLFLLLHVHQCSQCEFLCRNSERKKNVFFLLLVVLTVVSITVFCVCKDSLKMRKGKQNKNAKWCQKQNIFLLFFFSVKKLHGTKRNKCELINALEGELGSYQS